MLRGGLLWSYPTWMPGCIFFSQSARHCAGSTLFECIPAICDWNKAPVAWIPVIPHHPILQIPPRDFVDVTLFASSPCFWTLSHTFQDIKIKGRHISRLLVVISTAFACLRGTNSNFEVDWIQLAPSASWLIPISQAFHHTFPQVQTKKKQLVWNSIPATRARRGQGCHSSDSGVKGVNVLVLSCS